MKWDIFRFFRRSSDAAASATTPTPRGGGGLRVYCVGERNALAVATAYRCVKLLSESVAGLRLQYMVRRDGRYVEDVASPLHYLLTVEPQPERGAFTFWTMAVQWMLLEGNAYIFPRRSGSGEVSDLVLCDPRYVYFDKANLRYTINDPWNGVSGSFPIHDVIHLFLHSADGFTGESVLEHARRTMSIAVAGDEETQSRFENGGAVRGLVSNGNSTMGFGEYQDEQLARTAIDIDSHFRGGERIVSLPGQVDFKQLSLSSTDMQFLESRKFTVREVCRFFGVHPSFVFDDTSNNYKSAEMANVAFLSMTLDPILKRIENELQRKLVPRSECHGRLFRFDRRGIYSLDLDALASYQMKTIQTGIFTVNDWRQIENQPAVEGGDTVYISTNLTPLGSTPADKKDDDL